MGHGHGRGIWGSGGRIWPGEAVSWVGEALSGAAEAVVWVGCTMAQRSSNMGWGSCNMGRRGCIWALLWGSNEHAKTSRQQYIILPERIHFDISLSYISFSAY